MKYYKLLNNNQIIGAISSENFIYFSPVANSFLRCEEDKGEFISYKGQLYHATWMRPIVIQANYISIQALEISEEEYNIYAEAIEKNEEIIEEDEEEEIPVDNIPIDPVDTASIDFIRSSKLTEMSYACRKAIEQGFDLILRGESHHFSLTTQDQLNLMNIDITQELIPYHADGESYTYYTKDEIKQIIKAANDHKIYHNAYYNSLKEYINALGTIEEIAAITYGTTIPDEYKSDVLRVLE